MNKNNVYKDIYGLGFDRIKKTPYVLYMNIKDIDEAIINHGIDETFNILKSYDSNFNEANNSSDLKIYKLINNRWTNTKNLELITNRDYLTFDFASLFSKLGEKRSRKTMNAIYSILSKYLSKDYIRSEFKNSISMLNSSLDNFLLSLDDLEYNEKREIRVAIIKSLKDIDEVLKKPEIEVLNINNDTREVKTNLERTRVNKKYVA